MRRAYAGLLLALAGCDPTAGLADSADAAAPEQKRYFDGRGTQLSEGPWNRVVVDLDVETLYHLGARRSDDEQPTFHWFGASDTDGCEVRPNAGTWLMSKPRQAPERLLPFVEDLDERGRGRMRFMGMDCGVRELVIEDAGRPSSTPYDRGFLVPTKQGYTFADPWSGEQTELAANLQGVLVWDSAVLIQGDGQLRSFSAEFEPGPSWGNEPVSFVQLDREFLVEDADGLHRVSLDRQALTIEHEPILPDACHLQRSRSTSSDDTGTWIAVQMPCDDPKPTLLRLDGATFEIRDALELPFEADARYTRALIGVAVDGEPPPIGALYLTDVGDDGFGTLWAWREGLDAPLQLGEHAELDSGYPENPASAWDGAAHVNFQQLGSYRAYDWIRFRWDGTVDVVAERMLRSATTSDAIVNFDGVSGDLPFFDGDGYEVLARGITPAAGELSSFVGTNHFARVDEYDGSAGRLRIGTEEGAPFRWSDLASRVPPESARFSWFMPALVFLENWDDDTQTGRLVAYNYELDARATIAEGVSSFDLTSYPLEGVVYAVPRGKQRGLWFSKAK